MKLYFSLLRGAFKILKKGAYFIVIAFLLTEDCMQIRGLVMSHDGHKNMEYGRCAARTTHGDSRCDATMVTYLLPS